MHQYQVSFEQQTKHMVCTLIARVKEQNFGYKPTRSFIMTISHFLNVEISKSLKRERSPKLSSLVNYFSHKWNTKR